MTLPGGRVTIEMLQSKDLMTSVGEEEEGEVGAKREFDSDEDDGDFDGGAPSSSSSFAPPRVPGGAARARARLLEAAGYRVLAVDASKWLALQGKSDEEAGGGGGGGGAAAARDAALAALLRPLLLSDDGE